MNLNRTLGGVGGDFNIAFGIRAPDVRGQVEALIFDIGDLDEPPRPLARLKPIYPTQARVRKTEGRVILEFIVTADGHTRDITVISSQPGQIFTRAAIQAVQRWRFTPGKRKGVPVASRVRQKVDFNLH